MKGRPASDFTMQIEEPEPGELFIRFMYFEDRPEDPAGTVKSPHEQQLEYLRRLAYESKDQSVVAQILSDLVDKKTGAGR